MYSHHDWCVSPERYTWLIEHEWLKDHISQKNQKHKKTDITGSFENIFFSCGKEFGK